MTQEKGRKKKLKTEHCICIKTPRREGEGDASSTKRAKRGGRETRNKRASEVYGGNSHCVGRVRSARR